MEEKKVCRACKSHQVVRSYPSYEDPSSLEFYCLECYSRLFLDGGEEGSLTACLHCGMTLAEVRSGKLVGCVHCYKAMWSGIFPLVEKMQGVRAHRGKTPPVEEYETDYEEEREPLQKASRQKRSNELYVLAQERRGNGDLEGARYYEEKLTTLRNGGTLEEDFVCRSRQNLSKQS